jgi:hypothetical protein
MGIAPPPPLPRFAALPEGWTPDQHTETGWNPDSMDARRR